MKNTVRKSGEPNPQTTDLPRPKRGAFPASKEEIERAKPYVPVSDEVDGRQSAQGDSRADADQKDNEHSSVADAR